MSSAMSPAKRSAVLYISAAHAASSALLPGPARHRGRGHESLVALEAGRALHALRSDSGVPSAGEDEETEEDAAGLDCTDEEAGVGAGSHRRNELGRGPNVCAISMSSTASNFVSCKFASKISHNLLSRCGVETTDIPVEHSASTVVHCQTV
jgi:hypothetical protein